MKKTNEQIIKTSGYISIQRYCYYTTYPLDLNTFPKTPGGPIKLQPFDERQPVEGSTFRSWGILTYNEPLDEWLIAEYELREVSDQSALVCD